MPIFAEPEHYLFMILITVENMDKEYNFAKGERGKFYNSDAIFNLPIYLDTDNLRFVEKIAERKESDVSTVVNELIRSDREIARVIE